MFGVATAAFATINAVADTLTALLLVVLMVGDAVAVVLILETAALVSAVEVLVALVCEVLLIVEILTITITKQVQDLISHI